MTKPLFTTKHYKAIAEKFAGLLNSSSQPERKGLRYAVKCFMTEFQIGNPKFSREKFIKYFNSMLGSSKNNLNYLIYSYILWVVVRVLNP